jgi:raffinose/stachyose/melibiose transport system substrate-binding protein
MRKSHQRIALAAVATCLAAALAFLTGCGPGSSSGSTAPSQPKANAVVTNPAKLGNVTITEWDKNTFEGPNEAMERINEEFEKKYPNIKIHRVARSFENLKTTLKLALSSGSPPDVVQVNQGYGDVVAFAKANLIRRLDSYAQAYGWTKNYPPELLAQNRVSSEGIWGEGSLYGISSGSELVGVYYNKQLLAKLGIKVPTNFPEFEADLAKAQAAGIQPIEFGAQNKAPDIHLLGVPLTAIAGPKMVNDLVFGRDGASWTDPKVVKAIETIKEWSEKGYIPADANGLPEPQAGANFQKGSSLFFVSGSWWGGTFKETPTIAFTALAPKAGEPPATMGGLSLMWSITSKSANPEAAAAYINFVNGPEAADIIAEYGDLPANQHGTYESPAGSLQSDLSTSIHSVLTEGSMVPYLDYTTPDFYETLTSQMQQVTAGQTSPEDAAAALQQEAESLHNSLK